MFFEMVWRQASSISRMKGMLSSKQTSPPLKSVTAMLAYELGHRGDAGVDLLAEGGDAVFPALDAEAKDGLFQNGILVVFFV